VGDLEAVADAAQVPRFALLGISQGCAVSIALCGAPSRAGVASHPYGGYAVGWNKRVRSAAEKEEEAAMLTLMRLGWARRTRRSASYSPRSSSPARPKSRPTGSMSCSGSRYRGEMATRTYTAIRGDRCRLAPAARERSRRSCCTRAGMRACRSRPGGAWRPASRAPGSCPWRDATTCSSRPSRPSPSSSSRPARSWRLGREGPEVRHGHDLRPGVTFSSPSPTGPGWPGRRRSPAGRSGSR